MMKSRSGKRGSPDKQGAEHDVVFQRSPRRGRGSNRDLEVRGAIGAIWKDVGQSVASSTASSGSVE